jgi:hypothetical protein
MFSVQISWGSSEPSEPCTYEFKTAAERDAFLYGVDEASGWMDYTIISEEPADPHAIGVELS